MSTPKPESAPDWLGTQLAWITGPSWLLSVVTHGVLAVAIFVLSQLPSCQRDIAGNDGESFREVGIYERPAAPQEVETDSEEISDEPPPLAETFAEPTLVNPLEQPPPVELQLPTMDATPLIGAGVESALVDSTISDLVQPLQKPSTLNGQGKANPTPGGTSFLGIQDTGKRFVYVIDRSFSMENDNALAAAKAELQASLERLDQTQQFQIIFYNNDYVVLETRDGRFDMFWGTDPQRLQVNQQLSAISSAGGTRHMPAIQKALQFNPDVVFLLTDGAAESALSRAEIDQIRRQNRRGARIHCIEFGRGARNELRDEGNFLIRLAKLNGGKYTYRDVSRK